jgi:hypothetical protein
MSELAMVRLAAQVVCIGWAVWVPTPLAVHRYLAAQLTASVVGELTLSGALGDVTSQIYTIVCIALSLLVYATMVGIMRESIKHHPARLLAICVGTAASAGVAASVALGRNLGLFDWLATIDAAVLIFMAISTGLGAVHQTREWQRISLTLMVFWMAQAIFELGLTTQAWSATWMRTNEWLPAILVCAGCAGVARISRLKGRIQ